MTDSQIDFAVRTLRETGRLHQLIGWSLTLQSIDSCRREFTAQLTPVGRGSTVTDWVDLGRIAAAVGVPEGMMPESIRSAPNDVHRWEWNA